MPVEKAIAVQPIEPGESPATAALTSPYQVAVLTPTAVEAIAYRKTIDASDNALADNLAASRRSETLIRWLGNATSPFEPLLTKKPNSSQARAIEPLIRQARDEAVALLAQRDRLKAGRLELLTSRQAARAALENEIQTTRRDQLARLTGVGS